MDITNYMQKHHMVEKGDLVLAAVSGGADSVCMLLLLKDAAPALGFSLAAVHVEHGIRGEESLADMRFTQELCEGLGVPLRVYHASVPEEAARSGLGLEEAARKLRYQILDRAVREAAESGWPEASGCCRSTSRIRVALAHHIQDQAETVLFHLVRGSGARGLAGMQPVRQTSSGYALIRPMLKLQRAQIESCLKERGQSYRTDATNQDTTYARNRLRMQVMPELTQINAQAALHIAQAAERIAEQQDYIRQEAAHSLEEISRRREGRLYICIPHLQQLHAVIQKEMLSQALAETAGRRKDLTAVHLQQLLALAGGTSGGRLSLPYGVIAVREFDSLVLYRMDAQATQEEHPDQQFYITRDEMDRLLRTGESLTIALGSDEVLHLSVRSADEALYLSVSSADEAAATAAYELSDVGFASEKCKKTCTKCLDYDKIKEGFCIRRRQPGDYLQMADGHRKKLKKYLIEERIPADRRQRLWLLAQGHKVLWVVCGREST